MQVAINLTPVLITLIICVFMYAMCKIAHQDEKKKKPELRELKAPEFTNQRNNMHVLPSTQEQRLREYVEETIKNGESR